MLAFTLVTTVVGLFVTRLLVEWLGADRFGAFRLVLDWQTFLNLLELGLGGALAPLLARAFAHDDEPALQGTMSAASWAYLRVSVVAVVVGAALTFVLPRIVTNLSPADVVDLRTAWLVGLLGFLALSLTPFRAILEARQLGYRVNLLLTGQALLIAGVSLALARAGWGITGQAVAYVVGTWTFSLAVAFMVFRINPSLVRCWSVRADAGTHRALWGLSAATFLFNVSGRVSLMADNSIIGSMLGASLVTSLVNTQKLAVLSQSLLQGIGGATWAPLAELHARGEHEAFNRRLIELVRLVAIMSLASLGPIVAYNRHFVSFWMPPTFHYGGDAVVIISAVNAFLLSQLSLWGWCFGATGKTAILVPLAMTSAVVNVIASIVLTRQFGLVGPLLGTLTAFLAVNLWWLPRLMRQVFGTSQLELLRSAAVPLLCGIPPTLGLWWFTQHHRPPGFLAVVAEMGVAAVGVAIVSGAPILLDVNERLLWRHRLRIAFSRG